MSLILANTTAKSIEVILGAAPVAELPWTVSYSHSAQAEHSEALDRDGTTNASTPVTVVTPPGAGFWRKLLHFSLHNPSGNGDVTATVRLNNGTSTRILWSGTLHDKQTLFYEDHRGFYVDPEAAAAAAGTEDDLFFYLWAGGMR